MTEASYTAWDDKQYVWPPPDGWYQASDEKWWPEGYGPQPAEPDPAEPAEAAEVMDVDLAEDGAGSEDVSDVAEQIGSTDFGSDADSFGEAAKTSVMSSDGAGIGTTVESAVDSAVDAPDSFGSAVDGMSDQASGLADRASGFGGAASGLTDGIGDAASGLTDSTDGLGDVASSFTDSAKDGLGDAASGFGDTAEGVGDLIPDGVDDRVSISDVDGLPTADIGDLGSLDGLTERVSDFGDLPSPDLGDLPAPSADDLPAPNFNDLDLPPIGDVSGAGDIGDAVDDIPSIQDLASPDLDLSGFQDAAGLGQDVTQVVPTNIAGQFSDPLPPPPGNGPGFDTPPPPSADGMPSIDADVPGFDAPSIDASFEAPTIDTPGFDAPNINAPNIDAPNVDAPSFDAPSFEVPVVEPPTFDAPTIDAPSFGGPPQAPDLGMAAPGPNPVMGDVPGQLPPVGQAQPQVQIAQPQGGSGFGQPGAPGIGMPQDMLASNKGSGRGKTLLFVLLGVLALAIIGALLYWQFGRGGDGGDSEAVTTGPGSVNEPHPRTTGVVVFYPDGDTDQRWVIEVLNPVAVGAGDLASGAEDGDVFAVTQVRVRNESGANDASIGDLRFNAVNAAGELIDRQDNQCPTTAGDLDYNAAVPVGGEATGAVCWSVPASDLDGLKLGLESEKVAGRVHIALQ